MTVRNADKDLAEVTWQALKIGFNQPAGELADGMASWDGPTTATPLVRAKGVSGTPVLDVRGCAGDMTGVELAQLHLAQYGCRQNPY